MRTDRTVIHCAATACVALLLMTSGCASAGNTEKGAVIGAGAGAVAGGLIGKASGSTARGAIIGAAVGGAAGAVIGSRMDTQAEELQEDLPNATVERVGEGIQITFDSGILFGFDSSIIRSQAAANLGELAASPEDFEDTDVLIVGHTDSVGDADYNQRLSERRAHSAADFLHERGIALDRLHAVGRGESEPVATNDTEAGRELNRRVEVAIYASEELQERMIARHGNH